MKSESIVFGIACFCFGLIVGWVIATQQGAGHPVTAAAAVSQAAPSGAADQSAPPAPSGNSQQPVPLNTSQVQALTTQAADHPDDVAARIQLANMYFDAQQYQDAIRWYKEALALNPRDVNVSTDLGVSYYYVNQPDEALKQFQHSLSIDPKHLKTLLNVGIVRAFGKQDMAGAAKAWQQLIAIAPDSPEGQAAKQALDGMRSAHPGTNPGS
ncbi:MAG TPA: tetratricopeptide repeat protein [Vicinamibacterales bacterium]|jgi:Tfp pilus assembly protein PilF